MMLRFTTAKSFVSRAIRALTWSDFSHVEIVVPEAGYLGAHWQGGVQLRAWDYDQPSKQCFAVSRLEPMIEDKILIFAKEQIGKPYDLTALLGIAIHRDWHEPDHWFCSELVAAAFEAGGYPLIHEKINRVTPENLLESAELKVGPVLLR